MVESVTQGNTGKRASLMQDDLPEQIRAAVQMENRLTTIEAAQKAAHVSTDNLIAAVGELKGTLQEHARATQQRGEQQALAMEAIRDDLKSLRQEITDRRLWPRLDALEASKQSNDHHHASEAARTAGILSVLAFEWRGFVTGVGVVSALFAIGAHLAGWF